MHTPPRRRATDPDSKELRRATGKLEIIFSIYGEAICCQNLEAPS